MCFVQSSDSPSFRLTMSMAMSIGMEVKSEITSNDTTSSSAATSCNISTTRDSVSSGYPNTEKRAEDTTRSRVFLKNFEVFG